MISPMTDTIASQGAPNTAPTAGSQSNPSGQPPAGSADSKSTAPAPADQKGQEAKQTDNGKPADQKTPDGKPDADPAAKQPAKFELKLPEGAKLDAKHLEATVEYAKALGLNQEQAQKLLERDASLVEGHWKGMQANHAQQVEKWGDAVKNDKDLGGTNFDTTVTSARRAVDRFGSPDLKKALNETGLGNHPELVRMLAKIGKAMAEDSFVDSKNPAGKPKDAASVLYGSAG